MPNGMPPKSHMPLTRPRCILAFSVTTLALAGMSLPEAKAQLPAAGQGAGQGKQGPSTPALRPAPDAGLPMPRFVSLRTDRVNVRRGPGPEHGIDWVFRRAGLPVEVVAASDTWRRVRDAEGSSGWVLASLLSSRRTAVVEPWEVKPNAALPQVPLKADGRESAEDVALVEAGVIANVRACDGRWCLVGVANYSGYIQQHRLWGVYKGEVVK